MAATLYRSVTCNVQNTDTHADQGATLRKAWGYAEVLKLNEGNEIGNAIAALPDAAHYRPGGYVGEENTIIWRKSLFEKLDAGTKTLYVGGKGAGPSRGVVWVLLKHRPTGKRVLEFNTHQVAKAWTTETSRQPIWNKIANGVSAEINRVMAAYPGVPAVLSGDMNRSGSWSWPGLTGATEVNTPVSYGGARYDRFYTLGGITARNSNDLNTGSDHQTIICRMEITAASVVAGDPPPSSPVPVDTPDVDLPGKAPLVFPESEAVRRQSTWRARPRWRFFAQRMNGDGSDGDIIHPDLPLASPEIEDVLSGHNALTGTISPEFASLLADDGRPLLEEWGTAIWAEESGTIHGGGILTDSSFDGPDWSLTCTGLTGYAVDLPYADSVYFVQTDPLDIVRHIWTHIQAQPGGNIGLEVDSTVTGLKIGVELAQVDFDTQAGPVSFEAGPYKLAWYQTHDLSDNLDSLASDTPFDWHEEHYWVGDVLHHKLRLGYPNLGRRRNDLRFVIGENLHIKPSVERNGTDYADEAWVLGAGEGSAMLRGVARSNINKLRRVAVTANPSLRSQASVNAAAARDLSWRNTLENVSEVIVRDHAHADITSLQVGDEIRIQGPTGWIDLDAWYRVTSRRINPFDPNRMTLTIMRSDRIAAGAV
jgi:hypothetical protein